MSNKEQQEKTTELYNLIRKGFPSEGACISFTHEGKTITATYEGGQWVDAQTKRAIDAPNFWLPIAVELTGQGDNKED